MKRNAKTSKTSLLIFIFSIILLLFLSKTAEYSVSVPEFYTIAVDTDTTKQFFESENIATITMNSRDAAQFLKKGYVDAFINSRKINDSVYFQVMLANTNKANELRLMLLDHIDIIDSDLKKEILGVDDTIIDPIVVRVFDADDGKVTGFKTSSVKGNADKKDKLTEINIELEDDPNSYGNIRDLEVFNSVESLIISVFLLFFPFTFSGLYTLSMAKEKFQKTAETIVTSNVSLYELTMGKLIPYALATIFTLVGLLYILFPHMESISFLKLFFAYFIVFICLSAQNLLVILLIKDMRDVGIILTPIHIIFFFFLFFPSIFAKINDMALLSPITSATYLINNTPLLLSEFMFSLFSVSFMTVVLSFCCVLFLSEEQFILYDPLNTLQNRIIGFSQKKSTLFGLAFFSGILGGAFSYIFQILIVPLMLAMHRFLILPFFLIYAALVEELTKPVLFYPLFSKVQNFSKLTIITMGIMSGLGFYVTEKIIYFTYIFTFIDITSEVMALLLKLFSLNIITLLFHCLFSTVVTFAIFKAKGKPNNYFVTVIAFITLCHFILNVSLMGWLS